MSSNLTILCVTRAEPCILHLLRQMYHDSLTIGCEFVIAYDGVESRKSGYMANIPSHRSLTVQSSGCIESVLDKAVESCCTDYVLRLDDDESMSGPMVEWLRAVEYITHPHWKFPRAYLFRDANTCIVSPPLWPDFQTRLSTRAMSFGRTAIHCGSPFGAGRSAPNGVAIIHHKLLVKFIQQRECIVERYDLISPGAGTLVKAYNLPEKIYSESEMNLVDLDDLMLDGTEEKSKND